MEIHRKYYRRSLLVLYFHPKFSYSFTKLLKTSRKSKQTTIRIWLSQCVGHRRFSHFSICLRILLFYFGKKLPRKGCQIEKYNILGMSLGPPYDLVSEDAMHRHTSKTKNRKFTRVHTRFFFWTCNATNKHWRPCVASVHGQLRITTIHGCTFRPWEFRFNIYTRPATGYSMDPCRSVVKELHTYRLNRPNPIDR